MNGPRFDAWTRRHVAMAAGGVVAGVLGLASHQNIEARKNRKKKRRKRCKKLGAVCIEGGKRKCCGDLRCDRNFISPNPTFCCKVAGKLCGDDSECCNGLGCDENDQCTQLPPSDRNRKANFGSVDSADMLERVRTLPISTWNYTSDDPSVRHIGPMAQDFAAMFGVGSDDRHVHPIDGQGVALAAIQGLVAQLEQLKFENAQLAMRVHEMEARRG